ncbi:MAG: HAMP domain-containing protein, partial [Spirochaetia bacterium]
MSSENRKRSSRRIFRRIDVRLTAWFSLVFLLSSVALFAFTLWNLHRTLLNEDTRALQSMVLGHWARFQSAVSEEAGITQLINDIQTETMVHGDRPYFVRIATSSNNDVFIRIPLGEWFQAFDLAPLFDGAEPHAGGVITIPSDLLGYDLEVIGLPLSENFVIQIGMDTETRVRVTRLFQTSFLFTFAILFGVSVLGGLFFTSRSLRPIGSLSSTIKSIIETGNLDQRIPQVGGGDDLDDLVGSFNHMLDRVEQLVRGMRDALDVVAHDLRTPMTRFRATAETALAS